MKAATLSLPFFVLAVAAKVEFDPKSLAMLLSDIATVDNTELNLLSDFSPSSPSSEAKAEVISRLQEMEIPVATYDLKWLEYYQEHLPPEPCPIFGTGHAGGDHGDEDDEHHEEEKDDKEDDGHHGEEEEKIDEDGYHGKETTLTKLYPRDAPVLHMRSPLLKSHNHLLSVVVWADAAEDAERAYGIFDRTVMWCDQKIHVGMFNPGNRFYFFSEDRMEEVLFSFDRFRSHASVVSVHPLTSDSFAVRSFNFFTDESELRHVWHRERGRIKSARQVFTDQSAFSGRHFTIATNPWSHHVLGDEIPEEEGGNATLKYRDYWGYEIELLGAVSSFLDFRYTIVNPADGKWGHIEADGTWSGLVADVARGEVDFAICDIFIVYSRQQVFDGTIPFDKDYQAFAAPSPHPLPKYLSLVHPFTPLVWAALVSSVLAVSLTLWAVSRAEGSMLRWDFTDWSRLPRSIWYCYGTFIGESITRDTKSATGQALRWVIAVWIMYCLILATSYAGTLKAFLTTPSYTKPISSLKDVLDSGLPWKMVLYGEEEEEMMAQSQDPVIRTIWEGKIEEEYSPTPRIEGVHEGREVFIDWKSGLEPAIFSRYSTPRGDPLIYKSPHAVFMPNFPGWGFHSFNPWRPRFDEAIRLCLEAGLVEEWKYRTWVRMKEESRKKLGKIELKEEVVISALSLDHLQSVFYLSLLMLGFSLIVFTAELFGSLCRERQKESEEGSKDFGPPPQKNLGDYYQTYPSNFHSYHGKRPWAEEMPPPRSFQVSSFTMRNS